MVHDWCMINKIYISVTFLLEVVNPQMKNYNRQFNSAGLCLYNFNAILTRQCQ